MDLELAVKGEPSDGFLWVVKAPDGRTDLYLDAGIAVASIQSWAKLRCRKFGLMKTSALPTLWISGLIKVRLLVEAPWLCRVALSKAANRRTRGTDPPFYT